MDEVDFTVLAATSVFTDLIEKCPPAEACRDAFDRTVKATLKMANSTGGFGQNRHTSHTSAISRGNADHHAHHRQHRRDWASSRGHDSASHLSEAGAEFQQHRRPAVDAVVAGRIGPDLDVYSNSTSSPSSQSPAFQKRMQQNFQPRNEHQSCSSSGDALKYQATVAADGVSIGLGAMASPTASAALQSSPNPGVPVPRPLPPQLQQTSDGGGGLFSPAVAAGGYADFQGLDFLEGLYPQGGVDNVGSAVYGLDDRMDLGGLGLGWQGMYRDFNDGQQVDLFDGFFFGGGGGGGGGGGE